MQGIKNIQNKHIVLGGDFNLPHINWKKKSIKAGSNQHIQHQQLLDMEQELGFEQMQLSPSREGNILDLYFTTYPSLVKSCYTVPGISDHHMVVVDCDVKPRYKKKHRKLYIYKKANWTNIKSNLRARVCTLPILIVQLKPNGKTLERESSKPCHIIYLLNGQVTDLIFLG